MYESIESRIQTLLQGLTATFAEASQVTRGDWGVLDGGYDACAVLYPGAFEETGYAAANTVTRSFTVHLDLFRRIGGTNAEAVLSFIALRDAVLTGLQGYPTLDGLSGVLAVNTIAGDEPTWLYDDSGNGPNFIKETLDLRITAEETVASAET